MKRILLFFVLLVCIHSAIALDIDIPGSKIVRWYQNDQINNGGIANTSLSIYFKTRGPDVIDRIKLSGGHVGAIEPASGLFLKCDTWVYDRNNENSSVKWTLYHDFVQLSEKKNDSLIYEIPVKMRSVEDNLFFDCVFEYQLLIYNFIKEKEGGYYLDYQIDSLEDIEEVSYKVHLPNKFTNIDDTYIREMGLDLKEEQGGKTLFFNPPLNASQSVKKIDEDFNIATGKPTTVRIQKSILDRINDNLSLIFRIVIVLIIIIGVIIMFRRGQKPKDVGENLIRGISNLPLPKPKNQKKRKKQEKSKQNPSS